MRVRKGDGKVRRKKAAPKELIERSQARAFMRRWALVNALEKETLKATPVDDKLRQLAVLMISADRMGWKMKMETEVREIRDRWNKLRKVYRV